MKVDPDDPRALLATREGVAKVQAALGAMGFDAWLIYDFKDRNPIGRSLLGLEWTTRRGFALVPASGRPRLLIHAIEHSSWRHLDWPRESYSSRLANGGPKLRDLLAGCRRVATETSPRGDVPYLDLLPAGIREVIAGTGVELHSSGDLVSTFYAVWTPVQREEHGRASEVVRTLARDAFARAAGHVSRGETITEGALVHLDSRRAGPARHRRRSPTASWRSAPGRPIPTTTPARWASPSGGATSSSSTSGARSTRARSPPTRPGWATWAVRCRGGSGELWETLRAARDGVVDSLGARHARGEVIRGFEADDVARGIITDAGYGDWFIHRTGHSIDRDLHGRGPNLDNLETRDDRVLVPGVGFSVEPGIYIPDDVGMRTEINVFMGPDGTGGHGVGAAAGCVSSSVSARCFLAPRQAAAVRVTDVLTADPWVPETPAVAA